MFIFNTPTIGCQVKQDNKMLVGQKLKCKSLNSYISVNKIQVDNEITINIEHRMIKSLVTTNQHQVIKIISNIN